MIIEHSTTPLWVLRDGWPRILGVVLLVIGVEAANDYVRFDRPALSIGAVGLVVTAISIFLVFRVGEAYSRWWEARTLWGGIVNASRRFARHATTLIDAPDDDAASREEVAALRRELVHRQIAWVNALRLSLRRQDRWEELAPFLDPTERRALSSAANRPTRLLQTQSERLARARQRGLLSDLDLLMIERSISALQDAQGGCERIKNTAFPDHIAWTTQIFAWAVAALIAIAVIDPPNRIDPIDMLVVPFLMIAFIITDQLGAELRNPFENRQNDTPMTALCRTIEIDLRQQLGEQDVPPPLEPVDGVLM